MTERPAAPPSAVILAASSALVGAATALLLSEVWRKSRRRKGNQQGPGTALDAPWNGDRRWLPEEPLDPAQREADDAAAGSSSSSTDSDESGDIAGPLHRQEAQATTYRDSTSAAGRASRQPSEAKEEGGLNLAILPRHLRRASFDFDFTDDGRGGWNMRHEGRTIPIHREDGRNDTTLKKKDMKMEEDRSCSGDTSTASMSTSAKQLDVMVGTKCVDNDHIVQDAKTFEERIVKKITSLDEAKMLLRRTRAVAALSNRLMAAPDELSCFEEVSKLLVPLFSIDRCSYQLAVDEEHMVVKKVATTRKEFATELGVTFEDSGLVLPLEGTAVGECYRTRKPVYHPRTSQSPYKTHRLVHKMGLNTVLTTPILVPGGKWAGSINLAKTEEDAFSEQDRILIGDLASTLGAHVYAKRLREAERSASRISRDLLHSIIPPKVLAKIECYWDRESAEFQRRRSSVGNSSYVSSLCSLSEDEDDDDSEPNGSRARRRDLHPATNKERWTQIKRQVSFINGLNHAADDRDGKLGVVVDTTDSRPSSNDSASRDGCFNPSTSALYAEDVDNVCIIFTDVVGFSSIAMDVAPIQVMDMLGDLFTRFDYLCDRIGVLKLETIGDAYVCATGLLEDDDDDDEDEHKDVPSRQRDAALRALEMAESMVVEAREVIVPMPSTANGNGTRSAVPEMLEIRVGIHVGNITCGVLGQRMPKFTLYGNAVNLAARMEQTSEPSKIRITQDFYDVMGGAEMGLVTCQQRVEVKNMGTIDSHLLDPCGEGVMGKRRGIYF